MSFVEDFESLKAYIASNPNRGKGLDAVWRGGSSSSSSSSSCVPLPGKSEDWIHYSTVPAGALSAILFMLKPLYGQAPPGLRTQMLLEFRTEAAEVIDRECRGGKLARQRKKVQEWLSVDPAILTKDSISELWEVLTGVFQLQTVVLEENDLRHTEISFAPANIGNWRADRPIHIVDKSLGAVWVYAGDRMSLLRTIGSWLSGFELAGETIHWPTQADKTKAELVEYLEVTPSWRAEYAKRKKDELAEMAGRAQVVEMLARWAAGNVEYFEE